MAESTTETEDAGAAEAAAKGKSKPTKNLPSDRLVFDKQLSVLRAYAVAAGPERSPVAIADVAKIVSLNPNTISLCNPFFQDVGLIAREGFKFRPAEAVADYLQAHKWNQDTAATKLRPVIEATWFAKVLLQRLEFRPLPRAEALQVLAEEARATKDYEDHLEVLLDYLKAVGLIAYDANTVTLLTAPTPPAPVSIGTRADPPSQEPPVSAKPSANVRVFSIPIPGKEAASITVPANLDADDWEMLQAMIATYVKRWKNFPKSGAQKAMKSDQDEEDID